VHHFGALAAGVVGLSEQALVMQGDELPGFLAGWSPYELTLVGLPDRPNAERLDEIGLAFGTVRHDQPVLPTLADCCLCTPDTTVATSGWNQPIEQFPQPFWAVCWPYWPAQPLNAPLLRRLRVVRAAVSIIPTQ